MLSAWSVGLANEIQSEKIFATKPGQHLLIHGEEHPAHDQTNIAHLLSNKRGNQFTTYQEQVSYSDYCNLLLASLCRARQIPCQHFSWFWTASCVMPSLFTATPIDITHCHRHSQKHKEMKKKKKKD